MLKRSLIAGDRVPAADSSNCGKFDEASTRQVQRSEPYPDTGASGGGGGGGEETGAFLLVIGI